MSIRSGFINLALAAAVLLFSVTVHAAPITFAFWDFDSNPENRLEAAIDLTGNAAASISDNQSSTFAAGVQGESPSFAWNANGWGLDDSVDPGRYFQFHLDLSGYEFISLGLDLWRSSNGPETLAIGYSVNGSDFGLLGGTADLPFLGPVNEAGSWGHYLFDFSSLNPVLAGQSSVLFRLYGYGAESVFGTMRIDNVAFSGHALVSVPEPGTVGLLLLGLLTLGLCRRRFMCRQACAGQHY